jgi:hypothetical protein
MAEIRHLLSFIQGRSKQLNSLRINLPNEKDNLEKWVSCTQIKFEEVISYLESSGGNHIVRQQFKLLVEKVDLGKIYIELSNTENQKMFFEVFDLNQGLVWKSAHMFASKWQAYHLFDDLVAIGKLQLIRVIEMYNPSISEFSTYAIKSITKRMHFVFKNSRKGQEISYDYEGITRDGQPIAEIVKDGTTDSPIDSENKLLVETMKQIILKNPDLRNPIQDWQILCFRFGLQETKELDLKEIIEEMNLRDSKGKKQISHQALSQRIQKLLAIIKEDLMESEI